MAQETLKELKYNGSKVIAEVARRDALGRTIDTTYLTDVQIISEDEINAAFETVFGKNTTIKKLLDATKSARYLFAYYDGTSVDGLIKYDDTSNVTYMSNMFSGCSNLTTVPLLDTSNATSMYSMFSGCSNLTAVPLFDTSKILDINFMFKDCSNLTAIPAFNINSATNTATHMFDGCTNIEKIHMLNIRTSLDISYCTKMTREALLEVLGNLRYVSSSDHRILILGDTLLAKLTDDDKLIATNKNWTLA